MYSMGYGAAAHDLEGVWTRRSKCRDQRRILTQEKVVAGFEQEFRSHKL